MLVHDVLAGVVGRAHPWEAGPFHVHGAEAHACLFQHRCQRVQGPDTATLHCALELRFLLATAALLTHLVSVEGLGALLVVVVATPVVALPASLPRLLMLRPTHRKPALATLPPAAV